MTNPRVKFVPRGTLWFAAGIVVTVLVMRGLPDSVTGRLSPARDAIASTRHEPLAPATPPKTPGVVTLSDPRQVAQIETSLVTATPLPLTAPLAARLAYDENTTSRLTVPIDGRVLRMMKQVGDTVQAGEPIMEIDAPDLGQALADATKARADAALKRANLSRANDLYEHQVIALKEVESARADQAQAAAELERTELRLRNLNALGKVRGQSFLLSSPIGGMITERNATVGQQVLAASGNILATVTDPHRLMLVIDVPEADATRLSVGMPIDFTVDGSPGERFHAKLFRVSPQVDASTRRVQVRATVDNHDGKLRPEMFARALPTSLSGQTAATVPAASLLQFGSRTVVFVARDNGSYEQRDVEVAAQEGNDAWVRGNVTAGEKVVSAGALLLKTELVGL